MLGGLLVHMRRWLVPRSIRDANAAIDAELEHHLGETSDALLAKGWDADAARREAERRFGDVAEVRSRLLHEALAPNRRLTAIAGVGMLGVLSATGLMLGQRSQQLGDAEARVTTLRDEVVQLRAEAAGAGTARHIPMAQAVHFITIDGAVERPLVWVFSRRDDVTLRELIERSGGVRATASGRISVSRLRQGKAVAPRYLSPDEWTDPEGPDIVLDGSYYVYVEPVPTTDEAASERGPAVNPTRPAAASLAAAMTPRRLP